MRPRLLRQSGMSFVGLTCFFYLAISPFETEAQHNIRQAIFGVRMWVGSKRDRLRGQVDGLIRRRRRKNEMRQVVLVYGRALYMAGCSGPWFCLPTVRRGKQGGAAETHTIARAACCEQSQTPLLLRRLRQLHVGL